MPEETNPKEPKVTKETDFTKVIDPGMINYTESVVLKYKDVSISIAGDTGGVLEGRTADQAILFCADILRASVGDNSVEQTFDIHDSIKETLMINYGWSNIDFNEFVKNWRRNIYLKKIGESNHLEIDLEEYAQFQQYMEQKRKTEDGELEVGQEARSGMEAFVDGVSLTEEQKASKAEATIKALEATRMAKKKDGMYKTGKDEK